MGILGYFFLVLFWGWVLSPHKKDEDDYIY